MTDLSGRDRVPGARWVALFHAAPPPVQRALLSVGRRAPGRSVRWGNMRRLRPFSDRYGYDRGTPVDRYYIERFLSEHAGRIRGDVLEVKDAHYTRRFGDGARPHVVDLDSGNPAADLHADLNVPGSLPAERFDCVILTQVLQFLSPETALAKPPRPRHGPLALDPQRPGRAAPPRRDTGVRLRLRERARVRLRPVGPVGRGAEPGGAGLRGPALPPRRLRACSEAGMTVGQLPASGDRRRVPAGCRRQPAGSSSRRSR